jgi:monofunctional biosynthetic peptidoglycan transglycosylase
MILKGLLLITGLLTLWVLVAALHIWWLKGHNPGSTSWMRMRRNQAEDAGKPFKLKYTFVPIKQISRWVPRAVIAAEDGDFYKHNGFDWDAIRKAYKSNEKSGKIKRGGSTITQQLAKNLYLTPKRSYIRKIREGVITAVMERILSKERILELYVNCIEFGPGVFGIEEAARYHFGISAKSLTKEQACRLAAIIPSPLRYRVTGPYVIKRAGRIERAL